MDYHIYKKAKKRVKDKRRFYTHVISWAVMSVFFILLNIATSDYPWSIFPILGWGIGLAFHGIKVFSTVYGDDWEERQIEKEMEKLRRNENFRNQFEEDDDYDVELKLKKMPRQARGMRDSDFV